MPPKPKVVQKIPNETPSDVERFLTSELRFSRSNYVPWGKEIIRAIDFDDCLKLVEVFEVKAQLGAHVDVQVGASNYGGYIWTAWLHKLQGDTALHLAIRQKKLMCVYMLLALGAATDIENQSGQTAGDLCTKVYNRDIRELQKEALRELVTRIDPTRYTEFPKHTPVNYRSIAQEAVYMMNDGRILYSELPDCFGYDDVIPDPKAAPRAPKEKWVVRFDQKSKRKYKYNEWTGEMVWLQQEPKTKFGLAEIEFKELIQEDKWSIRFDENGNKYYMNETTGESTWDIPDAFKSKKSAKQKRDALQAAEDADYEFKKEGESDDEDDKAQMELLKKKRIQEEIDKAQAEEKRLAAVAEAARLAAEAVLQERRKLNNENRKAQRAKERLCGVSNTPGGWAVGDVWGRNRYTDVLRLIQRQRLRQDKEDEAERHRQSGLTLLSAANAAERPGVSRDLLKGLGDLKGYQKMKFMKMNQLRSLAIDWENNVDPRGDLELPIRYVTKLSTRTNMKGMSIGNVGFVAIFKALIGDRIIQDIILPGAGISLAAINQLAGPTLPAMKSIRVLDLSQNALCDDSAVALAKALLLTPTLVKVTVAANRITIDGAVPLVEAVLNERCSLSYFNMCNNHIRPGERDRLIALSVPYHISGKQNRFRPKYYSGPGGRKTIYPFTLTPFKKMDEQHMSQEKVVAVAVAFEGDDEPPFVPEGILTTSPSPSRPSRPPSPTKDEEGRSKTVTFDDASSSSPPAIAAQDDTTFDSFVYQGQGTVGQPGTASFRGLHVYL